MSDQELRPHITVTLPLKAEVMNAIDAAMDEHHPGWQYGPCAMNTAVWMIPVSTDRRATRRVKA